MIPMTPISHFAINVDDFEAAKSFYQQAFSWEYQKWGPPGFVQIVEDGQVVGAIQRRRELEPGLRLNAFECTIAVPDVDATAAAIVSAGGRILLPKAVIPTVGALIFAADPSGNVFGAMQYD